MSLFTGSGTALVTPFNESGVDFAAFERLLEYQLKNSASALFVLGTTGEPATMTEKEREEVIKFAVKFAGGKLPVIIGSGSNCTRIAVENSKRAEALGADGLLVVTPYYNKCTQKGLIEHYRSVCEGVGIPVIAYNVPTRTKVNIDPETAAKLCELKNMAALKEASGDIDQLQAVAAAIEGGMDLYIGDDSLTTVAVCLGAKGVISVAANVIPSVMAKLCKLCFEGKFDKARELQFKLIPLMSALFCEVNPIPVKKALEIIGLGCGVPRLPLTEMEPEHAEKLKAALVSLGLDKKGATL